MQKKRYIELECIDASLCIYANNIKISAEDVAKITRAWADGHTVVVSFNRWYGSEVKIEIKSVNNATQIAWWENDITKEWRKNARYLTRGQLPEEWIQIVENMGHEKEHVHI